MRLTGSQGRDIIVHEQPLTSEEAVTFSFNYLDLKDHSNLTMFSGDDAYHGALSGDRLICFPVPESSHQWAHLMPNPLRVLAQGRPLYTSHIKAWADDVSGNTTKQYNPHLNLYIAHANLPHTLLSQEYFVCFTSTSPHASSAEQFAGLEEQMRHVVSFNQSIRTHVATPDSVHRVS